MAQAQSIIKLGVEDSQYNKSIKQASTNLQYFIKTNGDLANALQKDSSKMSQFVQQIGKMESAATTAKGKVRDYSKAFEELSSIYNRLSDAEKKGQFGRDTAASMDAVRQKLKAANAEMEKTNSLMGRMSSSKGSGINVGQIGMQSLIGFAGAAGAAYMAFGKLKQGVEHAMEVTMQFETESATLASILGTSTGGVSMLTNQAKELGAATQYTAIQIVQLQTELAKLGFSQREIKDSTSAVQAFATATGADLAGAAALCGAALRAFGLDAKEMDRVASAMAVSTTKSALSYEKLNESLSTVAPVAKAFGFSIEDTLALLGKLSDAGFDASSAATATRNILLNLADSGGKLAQTLGAPVKSLDDMMKAFKDLKDKGVDLNTTLELTDKRSVAAFNQFLNTADGVLTLRDAVTDCSDEMKKMQEVKLDTLQGSITLLSSAWDGFVLNINNSRGALKSTIDWLTSELTTINELMTGIYGENEGKRSLGGLDIVQRKVAEINKLPEDQRAGAARQAAAEYRIKYEELKKQLDEYHSLGVFGRLGKEWDGFNPNDVAQKMKAYRSFYIEMSRYENEFRNPVSNNSDGIITSGGGVEVKGGKAKKSKERKLKINSLSDAIQLQGEHMFDFGSLSDYNNQLKELKKKMQEATDPAEYEMYYKRAEEIGNKIVSCMFSFNLQANTKDFQDQIAKEMAGALKGIKTESLGFDIVETRTDKITKNASSMSSAFDAASNSLGQFAEESQAAAIAQRSFSIMAAIAQLVAQFAAIPKGATVWDWIAGSISGAATLAGVVATIKSLGSYADGGVVPGAYNGGRDSTYVYASPGEVILNRSQQRNLAAQLTSGGQSSVTLRGEDLILAINNTGSRKGIGKIQFSR